jgi:hypothetical protein
MRKSVYVLMLTSCVVMSVGTSTVFAKDKNQSNHINVDADVSHGGKKGLDADVSASIGGRRGINADVDANSGGRKGVDADVDVDVGGRKGHDADVDVSLGGNKSLDADVDVTIDNKKGVNAGVDVLLGVDDGNSNTRPDLSNRNPVPGGLTASQRQAFNNMSPSERNALIKRCSAVNSGGYDAALVKLCKLLRMSALR